MVLDFQLAAPESSLEIHQGGIVEESQDGYAVTLLSES